MSECVKGGGVCEESVWVCEGWGSVCMCVSVGRVMESVCVMQDMII